MPAEEREKRILVVDDDDAIRTLLFTILRRRGFEVDVARGGSEAIERFSRCTYSMIVLDLMMPHVSGWDVLTELEARRHPDVAPPLVIVMTAGLEPHDLNPQYVAGVIRKPFDIDVLLDVIVGCWSTLTGERQSAECPPSDSRSWTRLPPGSRTN